MSKKNSKTVNEFVLIGEGDGLASELYMSGEFTPDGKKFNYEATEYWAKKVEGATGKIELKVGGAASVVLTDTAVTDGMNHVIEGGGAVNTETGEVTLDLTFTFTLADGSKGVTKAQETFKYPWP
jgi:hypothetical protein